MKNYIKYWPIGSSKAMKLESSTTILSANLLADAFPHLVFPHYAIFSSLFRYLLTTEEFEKSNFLFPAKCLETAEKQWQAAFSWMIGVAIARQLLHELGYRWIAPLSFFSEKSKPIPFGWPRQFPKTKITVTKSEPNISDLSPDFIAIRPSSLGQPLEFCLAEAKGTKKNLSKRASCPEDWYAQVRSVNLKMEGVNLFVPRHIVIASRILTAAKRKSTRVLTVRAWNSISAERPLELQAEDAVAFVVAHLASFLYKLEFIGAGETIANHLLTSLEYRESTPDRESITPPKLEQFKKRAEDAKLLMQDLRTSLFRLGIELSEHLVDLTSELVSAKDRKAAGSALIRFDQKLDFWIASEEKRNRYGDIILPFGVRIRML